MCQNMRAYLCTARGCGSTRYQRMSTNVMMILSRLNFRAGMLDETQIGANRTSELWPLLAVIPLNADEKGRGIPLGVVKRPVGHFEQAFRVKFCVLGNEGQSNRHVDWQ